MANYLPVLLVSVTTNATPDDTSVSTQARAQVDYLSHEWREEDVWRSWRNMTRQKNEIANGVRLENASWRTWWKQRNKLKTVSPETLNWLKDSDVTWLYGPLHTAVDWDPPPKPKCDPVSVEKQASTEDRLGVISVTDQSSRPSQRSKPILKHRSISDLLTSALPTLTSASNDADHDADDLDLDENDLEDDAVYEAPPRPPLLHTKSDTHVTRWARNRPFRKDSPPRIIASVQPPSPPAPTDTSQRVVAPPIDERSGSSDSARETTGSSQDLSAYPPGGKKKHISFNTYVEQCIAIDSPPKQKRGSLPGESRGTYDEVYDDGYEEDSEIEYNDPDDVLDEGGLFSEGHNGSDSDEEDEVLEMRTSLSRSRSSSSSRSPGVSGYSHRSHPPTAYPSGPLVHSASSDKEHVTIAPIAPTLLKTTGVGNHYVVSDFSGRDRMSPSPPVNLVYVPSLGSGYVLPRKNSGGALGESSSDDVYRHKGSRFSSSPGTSTSTSASSGSRSPPHAIPAAEALPIPRVLSPPVVESPMGAHEETYDYFGSAAAAQVHSTDLPASIRHADLGADFGPDTGALGVHLGRAVNMPEVVVVNGETGAIEERREGRPRSRSHSRSRSRSHSRTPSPAEMMAASSPSEPARTSPSPPTVSSPSPLPHDSTHLSPPDSYPSRGRTPPGVPSRSRSISNDAHTFEEPLGRGRSVARTSSFSDRERSSSRAGSVAGTGSPLGSVSPTSSSVGLSGNGIYSVYTQGRGGARRPNESTDSIGTGERGRGRAGRRASTSETSISPSSKGLSSEGRSLDAVAADVSPVLASPLCVSAPAPTPSPPASPAAPQPETSPSLPSPSQVSGSRARPSASKAPLSIPNIPTSIMEEEEPPRAPPVVTSPSVLRRVSPAVLAPPAPATAPVLAEKPQSPTSARSARRSLSPPGNPSEHGTLVGRAAEIVSSARGLLGALWSGSSNTSPGLP
ncbi:hypothetical protein BC834DRAFT_966562 [Gloeopeniophorella convolvens]|nr:hypothetical protein BC834DRAFT_966562 [Gloeopeniophorella convolvens]